MIVFKSMLDSMKKLGSEGSGSGEGGGLVVSPENCSTDFLIFAREFKNAKL